MTFSGWWVQRWPVKLKGSSRPTQHNSGIKKHHGLNHLVLRDSRFLIQPRISCRFQWWVSVEKNADDRWNVLDGYSAVEIWWLQPGATMKLRRNQVWSSSNKGQEPSLCPPFQFLAVKVRVLSRYMWRDDHWRTDGARHTLVALWIARPLRNLSALLHIFFRCQPGLHSPRCRAVGIWWLLYSLMQWWNFPALKSGAAAATQCLSQSLVFSHSIQPAAIL